MFPWLLVDPFLYQLSTIVIVACIVAIVVSLVAYFKFLRTDEEKTAQHIMNHLDLIRAGKWASTQKSVDSKTKQPVSVSAKKSFEIKGDELTLKKMLITKFKPLIEKQLNMKVEMKDFNAKGDKFFALTVISGSKFLFDLDSSGKILAYKRVK